MAPVSMTMSDPNPDFKVTILFNVKKLENGTRYICNGRPIESRINGKSHMVYRTAPFSITLSYLVFKVRPFFDTEYLTLIDLLPTFQGYNNIQRPITRLIVSRVRSINGSVSSDLE